MGHLTTSCYLDEAQQHAAARAKVLSGAEGADSNALATVRAGPHGQITLVLAITRNKGLAKHVGRQIVPLVFASKVPARDRKPLCWI